jgi:hypothetical protein
LSPGGVGLPGFWLDYYDADLAAGLPHDCLEGYIFDFAYNLLNLDYLQALNRLDDDDKVIVLDYMRTSETKDTNIIIKGILRLMHIMLLLSMFC